MFKVEKNESSSDLDFKLSAQVNKEWENVGV